MKSSKKFKSIFLTAAVLAMSFALLNVTAPKLKAADKLLFWSTQAKPVEETQAMRSQVLKGFGQEVDYKANDAGPWLTRLNAEIAANKGSISVLGALHGDFAALNSNDLVDLSDINLSGVSKTFVDLAKLNTNKQPYVPWMQASYVMAANKKALDYLPKNANIDSLTYDQLIQWAKNIYDETGKARFGFPAGPRGLKHRFFQGYLYPSYTNGVVRTFASKKAVLGWQKFKELWRYTNPASTNYSFLQEQLLSGDVWIAFDHTSRLANAFNQKPNDFVAFPAPAGPEGRGFMPVIAGLAIPKTAPNVKSAKELVRFMLSNNTQIETLKATSFFPVVDVKLPADMPAAVQATGTAIAKMSSSSDANPGLLPSGLGDKGGEFNRVFVDAFERIVLGNQNIKRVLNSQKRTLQKIMEEANAPCWAPDAPSKGACPVE